MLRASIISFVLTIFLFVAATPSTAIAPNLPPTISNDLFHRITLSKISSLENLEIILIPTPEISPTPLPTQVIASVQEAQNYALDILGTKQYSCLYILWQRESRWNPLAKNKSSGAYGIPQALPGNKMAKAGEDWLTNPLTQVKWGISYIQNRYGTACNALQHSYDYNWY